MPYLNETITLEEFNDFSNLMGLDHIGRNIAKKKCIEFYEEGTETHQNTIDDIYKPNIVEMVETINNLYKQDKKLHLLKIYPIAYIANCHINCNKFVYLLNQRRGEIEFEVVKGYNITTCRCVKMVNTEVHSVVRHIKSGELFDITKDFSLNIKDKFFIEVEWLSKYYTSLARKYKNRSMDCLFLEKHHRCIDGKIYDISYVQDASDCGIGKKDIKRKYEDVKDLELDLYDNKTSLHDSWIHLIHNKRATIFDGEYGILKWNEKCHNEMFMDDLDYNNEIHYHGTPPMTIHKAKKISAEENMTEEETLNTFLFKPNETKSKKKTKKTKKKGRK